MSIPRYRVRESAQTISAPAASASAIAAGVFPTPVGPARTTRLGPRTTPRVLASPATMGPGRARAGRGGGCRGGPGTPWRARRAPVLPAGGDNGVHAPFGVPAPLGVDGGGARGGRAVRPVVEPDELPGRRTAVHFIEGAIQGARDLDGPGRVLGGEQGFNGGLPPPAPLLHLFVFALVNGEQISPDPQRGQRPQVLAVLNERLPRFADQAGDPLPPSLGRHAVVMTG